MKITINDGNVSQKTNTTATFFDYIFILNKLNQAQIERQRRKKGLTY